MATRIPCALCKQDTFNQTRCICTECKNFHLCLNCFYNGMPVPPHSDSHEVLVYPGGLYQKQSNASSSCWTLDEERFLFICVITQGFGNWNEISLQMLTKTDLECKEHFFEKLNITPNKPGKTILQFKEENKKFISHIPQKLYERRNELGFLPFRLEFSTEPYNDTECLITDMGAVDSLKATLSPHLPDTSIFKEINFSNLNNKNNFKNNQAQYQILTNEVIKLYNQIICDRHFQKNFVLNSELIWKTENRRRKKDDDIYRLLRPFRRLTDSDEAFEELVEQLASQREIEECLAEELFCGIDLVSCMGEGKQKKNILAKISKASGLSELDIIELEKVIGSIVKGEKRENKMKGVLAAGKRYKVEKKKNIEEDEEYFVTVEDN